ncbi:MAG: hypothetical protein AB7K71_11970 [Polyangiaceae bacterium]
MNVVQFCEPAGASRYPTRSVLAIRESGAGLVVSIPGRVGDLDWGAMAATTIRVDLAAAQFLAESAAPLRAFGPVEAFRRRLLSVNQGNAAIRLSDGLAAVSELLGEQGAPIPHVIYDPERPSTSLELIRDDRRLGFSVEPDDISWFYAERDGQRRIDSGNVTAQTDFVELVGRMRRRSGQ